MHIESPGDEFIKSIQNLDADRDSTLGLIDEMLGMGVQQFLFTGIGETFMHKNVIEFMRYAKRTGSSCIANTNGTLLDQKIIDELIEMGFDELRVTTMAGTREAYLHTHPGVRDGMFNKIRESLLYLSERKAAIGIKKPKVSLCYIVLSTNYDGLNDFCELARLIRADRVLFRPVDTTGDENMAKLIPSTEQAAIVVKQLTEMKSYLESHKIIHNINYFLRIFKKQIDTSELYTIIPCYIGWLSARIDLLKGNVYPCCKCYEPLGNVFKQKFSEIWNGQAYSRFRKEALQINKRQTIVHVCDCNRCANHTPNLRVYKLLHPVKARSARLRQLSPTSSVDNSR